MKNRFTILSGVLALLCLGSCARKSDLPDASRITISPAITRVAGLDFEQGDEIGLSIARTSGIFADNVRMAYDGALFAADGLTWYETGEAADLVAYYPYVESGVPAAFDVAADQSSGCEDSDLLAAVKANVVPSSAAVGMVFRHMMAVVNITVTNQTGSAVTEVWIGGTIPSAQVNLAAQEAAPAPGVAASEIKTCPVTPGESYRAVVVPQTAALTVRVVTADGKARSAAFAPNALLLGKSYSIGLVVEKDALVPTLSGEVADWLPGGGLTPDGGSGSGENPGGNPGDGTGTESGTMVCMGTTYKTVQMGNRVWMAENLRYIPAEGVSNDGIWYPNNNNYAPTVQSYGMLYDYRNAYKFCPEGWRIPTEDDFNALLEVIEKPYSDFVPLAGVYITIQSRFKYFGQTAYLMGETPGVGVSKKKYLCNSGDETLQINEGYAADYGVSVRFVKDAD